MTRILLLAGVALLGLAAGQPGFAQSATDGETRDLIERLRPTEQQMRGIRMPGTDSGTATPSPAAPVLIPAAPAATPALDTPKPPAITAAPVPVPAAPAPAPGLVPAPTVAAPTVAVPAAPAPAPAAPAVTAAPAPTPPRTTTAPAGMAAVSITVNFATGSHALSPQAAAALTALGRALSSPELLPFRFRIEGHTDSVGDAAQNMVLSQRRAEAVRDYLVKGFPIAPFRLVAVGFGEDQLLVATPDNTAEPRNRRVQIVNLGG